MLLGLLVCVLLFFFQLLLFHEVTEVNGKCASVKCKVGLPVLIMISV